MIAIEDIEAARAANVLGQPPLQVRLHKDYGNLPGSIAMLLPRRFATRLIHKRLATPVASLDHLADIELTAQDLITIGFTEAQIA